jgi:4-amino-4-deoxy-L-arabinose transferase-like glycosyltransferase
MSTVSVPRPADLPAPVTRWPWTRLAQAVLRQRWTGIVLVSALGGFLIFYGLNAGELWRTESLRAIIAAEFLRSGNWVVPTLYGEPLFTKPPGMYAAIALVSWPLGGVTEWSARLPSALAAGALVLMFACYVGRQIGRLGGLVAGTVLPMSFMWLDKATSAEIDMLQVFWVSAAILCFLCALDAEDKETGFRSPCPLVPLSPCRATWSWWLASLLCVAGGVLTKWTAPAFFYGTAIPLLWWRGRLRLLWGRRHLVSALLAAGVCLAWVVAAVVMTGWDTFYETVSREALQRLSPSHHLEVRQLMSPRHQGHGYPWLGVIAHPLVVLGASLPWSIVALLTLRSGLARLWDERGRRLLQAMHCWVWPSLLFWSVIPEHAPRHSFPLFPGIAGLATLVWVAWLRGRLAWKLPRVTPRQVLIGGLTAWLVVKLVLVHGVIPHRNGGREPRAKGALLASLVPAGHVLYLFRLKDEGIMFYFGGTVRRLAAPEQLPSAAEPVYCILDAAEWEQWRLTRRVEVVRLLTDEQGDPIVLVRTAG